MTHLLVLADATVEEHEADDVRERGPHLVLTQWVTVMDSPREVMRRRVRADEVVAVFPVWGRETSRYDPFGPTSLVEGLAAGGGDGMNEEAVSSLTSLHVAVDLLALLPHDVPFVLKESQGEKGNLPPISASHHTEAAVYVARNCFWLRLDPADARRYSDLTGVKITDPRGNKTTWCLMVHPGEARQPTVKPHLCEATSQAIRRSLDRPAATTADRSATTGPRSGTICPVHFEEIPSGTGICQRCADG